MQMEHIDDEIIKFENEVLSGLSRQQAVEKIVTSEFPEHQRNILKQWAQQYCPEVLK
jgi:hypothetical protein